MIIISIIVIASERNGMKKNCIENVFVGIVNIPFRNFTPEECQVDTDYFLIRNVFIKWPI